jgi:hypothetical protein
MSTRFSDIDAHINISYPDTLLLSSLRFACGKGGRSSIDGYIPGDDEIDAAEDEVVGLGVVVKIDDALPIIPSRRLLRR